MAPRLLADWDAFRFLWIGGLGFRVSSLDVRSAGIGISGIRIAAAVATVAGVGFVGVVLLTFPLCCAFLGMDYV